MLYREKNSIYVSSLVLHFVPFILSISGCVEAYDPNNLIHDKSKPDANVREVTNQYKTETMVNCSEQTAMVAIASVEPKPVFLCAGALISSDLVLTTQACLNASKEAKDSSPTQWQPSPSSFQVFTQGGSASSKVIQIFFSKKTISDKPFLAILKLERALSVVPFSLVRGLELKVDHALTAVGHNASVYVNNVHMSRYCTHAYVQQISSREFTLTNAACSHYESSFAFDPESNVLLGLFSQFAQPCQSEGEPIYSRIEPFFDFIESIVGTKIQSISPSKSQPQPGSDMGASCTEDATCSTQICVKNETIGYCSKKCGDNEGRCPNGYHCTRNKNEITGICMKKI